jgi:hypothetical protein
LGVARNMKAWAGWWLSVIWLLVALSGILYFAAQWIYEPDNPRRHELRIGATMVFCYSVPALLAAFALSHRRFGLDASKRRVALALAVGVVIAYAALCLASSGVTQQALARETRARERRR